ncbi:heme-binding domain-containing protein [Edaphobacter aggregans]|uniref:heme-binding domain-containing protein n=1 Tax=Edaphobacter aggregans TaxID=570835 RepID=UPI000554A1D5|nr:heme-binding domain-containing protein [Edaphobacter aggregans]
MESRSNTRIILWLAAALFALFIAFQLVQPRLVNPPVTAELAAPPEVKRILKTSCYNCHSNETQLLWYDRIAPASWLVASDVYQARKHLNFSEIGKLPAAQQKAALYEAVNMIQLGAMPLPSYTMLHPQAHVSFGDLAVLKNYLNPPAPTLAPDEAAKTAADAQYEHLIHAGAAPLTVEPAPNGVPYIPGYKDWKVLSTTNRFDNKTLRVIFGNDVAMKAIAEHHTNPWPDGTTFAKTAWFQQIDANGDTKTGAFFQVEFMIKDAHKYASTEGWGFARWRGADLKPYGKDAAFTNECTGCHAPLRHNDYVYSFPLEGQQ